MSIEENINNEQITNDPSKNFKSIKTYLIIGGVAGILFGLIHAWGIFSEGFTYIRFGDAVINSLIGILFLFCSRLVSQGKLLSMWVFASTIFLSLGYSFVVGRGLNYFYAVIGAVILLLFINLKKNKELT